MTGYADHVRAVVDQAPPFTDEQRARISGLLRGVTVAPPTREQQVITWLSRYMYEHGRSAVAAEVVKAAAKVGIRDRELITAAGSLDMKRVNGGRRWALPANTDPATLRRPVAGGSPRQFPHQPGATKVEADTSRTAVVRDDRTRQTQRARTSHSECDHEPTQSARLKCRRARDRGAA